MEVSKSNFKGISNIGIVNIIISKLYRATLELVPVLNFLQVFKYYVYTASWRIKKYIPNLLEFAHLRYTGQLIQFNREYGSHFGFPDSFLV